MRSRRFFYSVALCVGFFMLFFASIAMADAALEIETATDKDDLIIATVVLNGVDDVSGIYFTVTYETDKLILQNYHKGMLEGNYTITDTEKGKVGFAWYHETSASAKQSAELLKLTFRPISEGETRIAIDRSVPIMIIGSKANNITVNTVSATIDLPVISPAEGSQSLQNEIIASDGNAAAGQKIGAMDIAPSAAGEDLPNIEVLSSQAEPSGNGVYIAVSVVSLLIAAAAIAFAYWKVNSMKKLLASSNNAGKQSDDIERPHDDAIKVK